MFGWFKPTCPVAPEERLWVESRMRWLVAQFGAEQARSAPVVLPTPEFFPEPYEPTEEGGAMLFRRVCGYLRIDPAPIDLHFYEERRMPLQGDGWQRHEGTAGLYQGASWGTLIQLEVSALQDPLALVATAAHELCHFLLLGQGRLTGDEPDHEELTDLLTIYLGLGVFTANSRIRSSAGHEGLTESWSIRRLGYLSQPKTGYALAVHAGLREEEDPPWAGHLCADVRSVFKKGHRWLRQEGRPPLGPADDSGALLSDDELPPGFRPRR
jgi:hypothetical protein